MIDRAVALVADRLNQHLRAQFDLAEDLVALTPPTDAEGKPAPSARNRLLVFVTGVAQEGAARAARPRLAAVGGGVGVMAEPVRLNVFLMLAANFDPDNYGESLKVLSAAARFFQANPVFDPSRTPGMDRGLSQLALDMSDLSPETMNQLWTVHGGRYLPSIHYRMRLVTIDAAAVTREAPLAIRPETGAAPKGPNAEAGAG
jgi:hypothetical protein